MRSLLGTPLIGLILLRCSIAAAGGTGAREVLGGTLSAAGPARINALGMTSLNRLVMPMGGQGLFFQDNPQALDFLADHIPAEQLSSLATLSMRDRLEAVGEAAARAESTLGEQLAQAVDAKVHRKEKLGVASAHDEGILELASRQRIYVSPGNYYKLRFLSQAQAEADFLTDEAMQRLRVSGVPTTGSGSHITAAGRNSKEIARSIALKPRLGWLHKRALTQDQWVADWLVTNVDGIEKIEERLLPGKFDAVITILRHPNLQRALDLTQGRIVFRKRDIGTGAYYPPAPRSLMEKVALWLSPAFALAFPTGLMFAGVPAWVLLATAPIIIFAGFNLLWNLLWKLDAVERRILGHRGGIVVSSHFDAGIVAHEIAHRLDNQLLSRFPYFKSRLEDLFAAASSQRHGVQVLNPYALTNIKEYFAVGVQAYFSHGRLQPMGTRADLKVKDPGLYALIDEIFGSYADSIPDHPSMDYLAPN